MTITSTGYERAISYAELGSIVSYSGTTYGVFSSGSFAASAGPGTREVRIAAGTASGFGILDVSDAVASVSGSSVSSGSRWDLVVLRRNWSTKTTTLVIITGSSTQAIPSRNTNNGTLDDQPLWLVRFAAGQTTPQEFIDLRVWQGDGGTVGKHLMVRDYMTRIGSSVWIAGALWVRGFNTSGSATWVSFVQGTHANTETEIDDTIADVNAATASAVAGKLARFSSTTNTLGVPDPTSDSHVANKKYVDNLPLVKGDFKVTKNLTVTESATVAGKAVVDQRDAASNSDAQAGTATTKFVTPASLAARTATTSRTGLSELATQGEVDGGTDGTKIVTPATLRSSANLPYAMAAGRVLSSGGGASNGAIFWDAGKTITFPSGRFTVPPIITATPDSGGYDAVMIGVSIRNFGATSFFARVLRVGTAPQNDMGMHWQAVQMKSGTAGG